MKNFKIAFKKEVYGFFMVEAKNEQEAKELILNGDFDEEFENKVNYVYQKDNGEETEDIEEAGVYE